jgi:phosphoribosylaminoimidazole-succinocarboxamide synthase
MSIVYSGKAKDIYSTDVPSRYIMCFRNDLTALNGGKKGGFEGKGEINCKVSAFIFRYLESLGIKTQYIDIISSQEQLVKKVNILPIEVIVRNISAGSFSRKYGVAEGILLNAPVLEFSLKNDALGDPMISASHAIALNLATPEQLEEISRLALQINQALIELMNRADLTLVDFKLEFGVDENGAVLLADEISPDTCRLWEKSSNERLDKDRFRLDLGGVEAAYLEAGRRLLVLEKEGE